MKRKLFYQCLLLIATAFLTPFFVHAQPTNPNEILRQHVADLQKNPNDYALREKIIKHVQTMRPTPAVPEEVDELLGQVSYIMKTAKAAADYTDAATAYRKVLLLAPWVAPYYFDLGTVLEKVGKYDEAIANFRLYLMAAPEAQDAKAVRGKIGALKYAAEKGSRESQTAKPVEIKLDPFEALLKKIDGRRYTASFENGVQGVIEVQGRFFKFGWYNANGVYSVPASNHLTEIKGLVTLAPINVISPVSTLISNTFTISEDGSWVKFRGTYRDGTFTENYYMWQR
jgi:tetratricopeptide (TPR) repeat protein